MAVRLGTAHLLVSKLALVVLEVLILQRSGGGGGGGRNYAAYSKQELADGIRFINFVYLPIEIYIIS